MAAWQAIVGDSPVGHVLLDHDGRYLLINPALAAMIGLPADQLLGRTVEEILPSLWEQLRGPLRQVVETGERVEFDVTGTTPADPATRHHWLVEYYPVRAAGGALLGVGGAVLDRSEARRAQALLAARERQQAVTAELGVLALRQHDLVGIVSEVVDRAARTLGVEFAEVLELSPVGDALRPIAVRGFPERPEETLGNADPTQASPEALCHQTSAIVRVEDLSSDDRFTLPSFLSDSGVVSGLCAPILGRNAPFGVLAVFTTGPRTFTPDDASFVASCANIVASAAEHLRAEDAERYFSTVSEVLARSLDLSETLDEISQLAVPTLGDRCWIDITDIEHGDASRDPDAEPARWQPPTGLAPPPASRLTLISDLASPDVEAAGAVSDYAAALRLEGYRRLILAPLTARGRSLGSLAIVSETPLSQPGGRIAALAAGFMRRASSAVDNALLYREAEHAGRAREQFTEMASHELRNPLTNVLGFAELLNRRLEADVSGVDQAVREDIHTIWTEAGRMQRTLELFLTMARLESGRVPPAATPVDLSSLLNDEVARLRRRAPEALIRAHLPVESVPIVSDDDRIREVVSNLLDNAVKYGGDPPVVDLSLHEDADSARISVRDNGAGIASADQPHVFDRAYRGDVQATTRGSGLGLYICRLIAQSLGADLSFESGQGGSEFHLRIPRSDPSAPMSSAPQA